MDFYDRHPDAPSAAEAARDEAEATCARKGHDLGETEDGDVVCVRCGSEALDVEAPEDDEREPTEDEQQRWAQQDIDRANGRTA